MKTKIIRAISDKDGFIRGFIKGMTGCMMFISMLVIFTGCFG